MSNSKKNLIIVLSILALAVVIGFCMIALVIGIRAYQQRYIECDPKKLLSIVELVFDVNFPVNIEDVKAAKTQSIERYEKFIVKFCADPNIVSRFLESVKDSSRSVPYERKHTFTTGGWPSPGWARATINQGRKYTLHSTDKQPSVSTNVDLYVDTTDKKNIVVYLEGTYRTRIDK